MRTHRRRFIASLSAALIWLVFSALAAIPWAREVARHLPVGYVFWVICGIALLPGYLMCAMFVSNLMNAQITPISSSPAERISILMCARNEETGIYQTIEGIARQQYEGEIDLFCIDNASTDGTAREIERAQECLQRPGCRIQRLSCLTPGKAHALNAGLSRITSRYFVTVDADTWLSPSALSALIHRMTVSGAGCVAGNLLVARPRTWIEKMQIYDYLISIAAVKRYQGSYGAILVAQGAFSAYDTEAVKALGGWTQGAGEDIILTYRLLGAGRCSLYEAQAIAYTLTPSTLKGLCRQRTRWARGLIEGLRAVRPWQQATAYGGYFEALNLSIIYLDLAFLFGYLVGVALLICGLSWFVGYLTLLLLPLLLIGCASVYRFQRRLPAIQITDSPLGFLCFLLLFQPIQSCCSLAGYAHALLSRKLVWKP